MAGASPRKTATNLSLPPGLVKRAKALGLNVSMLVEAALEQAVKAAEAKRWLEENREAIDEYNAMVAERGVFSDGAAAILMAQFDVHKDRKAKLYPLLLDVQADLLAHLATRIVVPLALKRTYPAKPLRLVNPTVLVRNVEYVAVFQELAAISAHELGDVVGSLVSQRTALIAGLDFVFTGS